MNGECVTVCVMVWSLKSEVQGARRLIFGFQLSAAGSKSHVSLLDT
jgi:hypothetical protein